jgi:high-affinity iron transporter
MIDCSVGFDSRDRSVPPITASALDIAVLVFREGLECVLVIAAIMASMTGPDRAHRRPIALGILAGMVATVATWWGAVRVLDELTSDVSALQLQAATGLLAVCVLIVVMNWFFHKVYWTGWISLHTRRKAELVKQSRVNPGRRRGVVLGLAALGFTSLYREGFEVVLFLQSYRLRLGGDIVALGVAIGLAGAGLIAVLTFALHRRLPYRRMLVVTGVLLGAVLLVMVGEQAQEMQLAHWLPTTPIEPLARVLPDWAGVWFSVFPTWETIAAQLLAGTAVIGSYYIASARREDSDAITPQSAVS